MTRTVVVLRPEPGNSATAARARARGLSVSQAPLFEIRALTWPVPDPADHDGMLITSANAVRTAGDGLAALRQLPVLAVGDATAAVARACRLDVRLVGDTDAAALIDVARARGFARLLHLRGADTTVAKGGIVTESIAVYDSVARPTAASILAALPDSVALLHSPRAARHFAMIVGDARATIRIAALSDAVASAAGDGWAAIAVARSPGEADLLDVAQSLID